jgi:N-acetylglutamate synthase-like GNAT family acetyltransferase
MKDCNDLLEVYAGSRYQGTLWHYRVQDGTYTTAEQIKEEHRGPAFERWGWLVAEQNGKVVGEIVFRVEKNPNGRIGIIRNLDVDVRYHRAKVGTELTRAAEQVMKKKRVSMVITTTPPSAYNYWMKVGYYARGSILEVRKPLSRIPERRTRKVKAVRVSTKQTRLPKSMRFSNIAYPGSLAELAADIIEGRLNGRLFEFYSEEKLVGVGAIAKSAKTIASLVADVTKKGLGFADVVISRTARAASSLKANRVESRIPKSSLDAFNSLVKWSSTDSTDIPVTRLL